MSIIAGQVTSINGRYIVICEDGSNRVIGLHDTIYEGEEVKAEGGNHLVISNGENTFVAEENANFMIQNGISVTPHCDDGCGNVIPVFEEPVVDKFQTHEAVIHSYKEPIIDKFLTDEDDTEHTTIQTFGGGGGGSVASRYVEDSSAEGYAHIEATPVSSYSTDAQCITNGNSNIGAINIANANAEATNITNITNITQSDDESYDKGFDDGYDKGYDDSQAKYENILETDTNINYAQETTDCDDEVNIKDVLPTLGSDDEINMSNLTTEEKPTQKYDTCEETKTKEQNLNTENVDLSNTNTMSNSEYIVEIDQY